MAISAGNLPWLFAPCPLQFYERCPGYGPLRLGRSTMRTTTNKNLYQRATETARLESKSERPYISLGFLRLFRQSDDRPNLIG